MIGTDDFPVLFGIELAGKFSRVHEVAEHDGELAAFGFWCGWFEGWCDLRGLIVLGRRSLGWLRRGRGCDRGVGSVPSPHEDSAIFICGKLLCLDDLCLEGFEILVIEAKPYLEGRIRHASLAFQEVDDLGENLIEGHR